MERYFKKIDSRQITTTNPEINENVEVWPCLIQESLEVESPHAKLKKTHKYLKSWEEDPILKPWLTCRNTLPHCHVCSCDLKGAGGVNDLKQHAKTSKHITNSNAINIHCASTKLFSGISSSNQAITTAELKLSAFCAEHNISFATMDHLIPVLKSALPDSEIVKNLSCARTKTTAIVKNVIEESQLQDICKLCNNNYFSLCIDESTDISTTKLLSLVVRTELRGKISDFFLGLLKIEVCDAFSIYNKIVSFFIDRQINYKKNLIGFAADGANVMTGANHSVATLLKHDCPELIIFKCACHSFALCANHACKQLPRYVESCVRDIYNFIQNSPKRIELYSSLQILLEYRPKKILHPSQTRWLSLEATVVQILSRFEVLRLFFIHEDVEKFDAVQRINKYLDNKQFELFLRFLRFILNDINKLNRLFQSESPQLHVLYHEVTRLYYKIFEYFIKENFLGADYLIENNLNNSEILKELKDVYLGADVNTALTTTHVLLENDEMEFRVHCQQFYVELCNHLIKKFDFGDKMLEAFQILAPTNVINKQNLSCANLMVFFPQVINRSNLQNVDDEWREIRLLNFSELELGEEVAVDTFWYKILDLKRCDGRLCFPYLKSAIMAILTIPVATANVERIFSQINLNKTKTRNCLDSSTLAGILLSKDYIKKNYKDCTHFEPSKEMMTKFNSEMYKGIF